MADALIGKVKAMFVGDSTNLVEATKKAEKALEEMGDKATSSAEETQAAAKKTEKSLDKIGEQAKETARETDKALDKAEDAVDDLGDTTEKVAKDSSVAMKRLADQIGTAFATAQLVRFGRQSVMAAADVAEALNATRVIFGESSSEIEAFAATASTNLGQSRKSVLDASNTFATFGKSAGLAGQDLNDFTLQMVNLSSDLASFRNTTPEDAIMAIGAALRGEMEPIRRYGVLLNDATLTQEAMAMGLVNTTKGALEPSVKVLAAQAAILKQTTDAQGDFARTSTSLSNQVKIANAQIADMKANIGTALVPAVQGALIPLNLMAGVFNKLDTGTQKLVGQLFFLNASLLLVQRAMRNFGYTGAFVSKAMIGLNAAMVAAVAVSKIFAAGSQNNTREVQDFTRALQENDAALRNNSIEQLAQQDPEVRDYLNTLGELGLTLNNMAQYLKTLDGPAAEARNQLAEIARTGLDAKSKLALVNQELGTNYDVTNLTAEGAENLWTRLHNLQFVLFNLEQDWRNNTLGTNAFAAALGGVSADGEGVNSVLTETADTFDKYRQAVLGATWATERDFTKAVAQAEIEAQRFASGLEQGKMSSAELEVALIDQADKMLQLQYAAGDSTEKLKAITPAMRMIVAAMYKAGAASGKTVPQVSALVKELGLLDGIDPRIAIYLEMDVSQIEAQVAQLRNALNVAKRIGNLGMYAGIMKELEPLVAMLDAIHQVEVSGPKSSGGGGGAADGPFAWVADYVSAVADAANSMIGKDFANLLVKGSADDVREAFSRLLEIATDLNLQQTPGFDKLLSNIKTKFESLANLSGRRLDLTEQIEDATSALEGLRDQLEDIRLAQEEWLVSTQQKSPTLSLIDQALEAQEKYEALYANASELRSQRNSFIDEVTGSVASPLRAGRSALGQTTRLLADARKYRDNLIALRDRGFGPDVLREVINAGVADGNKIARSLLSMSSSDMASFVQMRQEIAAIGVEAGTLVSDLVFGADIADAEKKLDAQRSLVNQLFSQAVSEAQANIKKQETVVSGLNTQLGRTEQAIRDLTYAIQVNLYDTFFGFLAGFQDGLSQLKGAPTRVPALANGGIVTSPTLAVVGEAGSEAIIPLNEMGSFGNSPVNVYVVVEGSVTSENDLVESIRKGLLTAQRSGRQVVL